MELRRWGELAAAVVLAGLIAGGLWSRAAEPRRVADRPLPTIGPLWILNTLPDGYSGDVGPQVFQAPAPVGCDRLSYGLANGSRVRSLVLERGDCEDGLPAWRGPPEGLAGFEAFAGLRLGSPEPEVLQRLGAPDARLGRTHYLWLRSCDEQGRLVAEDSEQAVWSLTFRVTIVEGVAVGYSVVAD